MKKKGTSFELENKSEWEKQKEKRKNNPLGLDELDKHRFEDYLIQLIDERIGRNEEKQLLKRIEAKFDKVAKETLERIKESGNLPRVSGLPTGLPSGEAINYDNFDKVESFFYRNVYEFKLKCNVFAITEDGLKTTKRVYTKGEYDIEIFNNKNKEIEIWFCGETKEFKLEPSEIYNVKFTEEPTASKKEIVEGEKLTIDNYKRLQRFGYEGAKFERNGGYTHFIAFKSKTEDAIIYEEEGKIKGKIWLKDAKNKDYDYISIEDLVELEFKRD